MFQESGAGTLHHIAGNRLFASRADKIYAADAGHPLRLFARLPLGGLDRATSPIRLLARLRRKMIHHIVSYRDKVVVMAFGRIWCLDARDGRLLGEPAPIKGSRPLALCASPSGLYYGEYRNNPDRSSIRLFHSEDGLRWSQAAVFEGVRHIHGVYHDSYTDSIWVTTGDSDAESAIWRSSNNFGSVERVLSGSQKVRAIPLLFTDRYVFFGSDAPDEINRIYCYDRRNHSVRSVQEVGGTVFHACKAGEWLLFSTAVEPSRVNLSRDSVLYASRGGEEWRIIARHRKDFWHRKLFQYGQIMLPTGDNQTGKLWYSTFAVEKEQTIFSAILH